ncbi:glycosyltransferase family 2 protein [Butyrivibrio sp. YAB3001]|uniref:glycosyltransferase family 2 protein n=1 Tax=Butyrivibrio sp. YAB3001 TaxID=1520812 RepID=UPI0008F64B13|nr:glycosyltransferase family 2 protein [Butyrivibrio sp. YAB3001]SFC74245.1 Glycosyltransferase involved in cell wall bisynthesis [Butyrivibrio sp. YAB3001]
MIENNPEFSVIIPVYNVKDYLNACIDSILEQSYKNFEIILVDDGSTDGSETICDEYSKKYNNIYVYHKQNGGQSSARNIGVEHANGTYFIFVDSDDFIATNTLEMFKERIDQLTTVDVILSEEMSEVRNDGTIVPPDNKLDQQEYFRLNGQMALTKMYQTIPNWSPCGKCYRTEYWRNKTFKFIEGRISEDLQLIDRVILEADVVSMVSPHYYYRSRIMTSTMHKNYYKLVDDTIFVIDDWIDYLNQKKLNKELNELILKSLANTLEHIALANIYYVPKEQRGVLTGKAYKCVSILRYDTSLEGKATMYAISLIGLDLTCLILNKIKSFRKKRKSIK